jgi:glucokinase
VREARLIAGQRRPEASLLLSLGDGTPEGVSGKAVTEAAHQGDPVALAAFNRVGAWLGRGMADLAAILDPGRFVVGGGVSEAGDLLLVPARAAFLENLSAREHRPIADVVQATVQNDAGLLGAADLARTI